MRTTRSILKAIYGYTDMELDSLSVPRDYPLEVKHVRCFGGDNCVCNEVA